MPEKNCPVCNLVLGGEENYCSRCGNSLRNGRGRRGEPAPPRWLEIEFQESRSPSYNTALDLCMGNPHYRSFERNGLKIHRAGYRAEEAKDFLRLANLVRGWKSFRLFVDGREETWRSFFYGGYYCFEDRDSSPSCNQYCYGESSEWFNWWGCHRLGFGFYNEEDWLRSGKMTDDDIFIPDKDRIKRLLLSRARSHRFCPIMNTEAILKRVDALPDRIDPRANPDWEFYFIDWRDEPGAPPAAAVPVCSPRSLLVSSLVPPDVVVPNPPDRGAWSPGGPPGFE